MGGAPLSWKREVIRTSFSVYPPIKPSHTNIEKEARWTSGAHEWRPGPARRRGGRGEADRPLTAAGPAKVNETVCRQTASWPRPQVPPWPSVRLAGGLRRCWVSVAVRLVAAVLVIAVVCVWRAF